MPSTVVAYIHKDEWSHSFGKSMQLLTTQNVGGHIADIIDGRSNAGGLPEARNLATQHFLDETDHDWLFFVDTDMGFKPTALAMLHQIADPDERPIVGGLCFGQREMTNDGRAGYRWSPRPTIFDWFNTGDEPEVFHYRMHYPVNGVLQCDATGGAFVLIHRRVCTEIREAYGDNWFTRIEVATGRISEDLSFFKRWHDLHGRGGCHIHTGVRVTHAKTTWIDERDFWEQLPVIPALDEVDVIVPVLHRPQNVRPLLQSLRASTGLATAWFVCDVDDKEEQAEVERYGGRVLRHDGTFAQKVNHALGKIKPKAPWVFLTGDDVMFHPSWLDHAQHVAKNYGALVIGTNDLGNPRVMSGEHATHLLINREYIEQVGASWDGPGVACHEGYRHWFVDDEIVAAAKQRGVWQMALGSYVEHMHPYWGKGEPDDVYELGQANNEADRDTFQARLNEHTGPPPRLDELVGVVVDGHGACAGDVERGMYSGFMPDAYPGSLNVDIGHTAWISQMPEPDAQITHPHGYPLLFWKGTVGDVNLWVMWPQRAPHESHVEVFARVRLRDALGVENGDKVVLEIGEGR